jgi:ComF family protein
LGVCGRRRSRSRLDAQQAGLRIGLSQYRLAATAMSPPVDHRLGLLPDHRQALGHAPSHLAVQPRRRGSAGLAALHARQRCCIDGSGRHASGHARRHEQVVEAVGRHGLGGQYIEPMPLRTLLPTQCAVCRGWDRSRICSDCLQRHAAPRPRCSLCAIAVPVGTAVCGGCLQSPPPFTRSIAAVDYAYPWSGLVAAFKFRAALDLAPALAALLADAMHACDAPRPALLLPVPLSTERLAERGMNQAWELARRVGAQAGIPARADVLRRLIDTPHLADLPREQRSARIRGAFGVAPGHADRLRGRCVALVDDVMTSGATAAEATRVLLAAGAAAVQVWVVARTPAPNET